MVKFSIYLNRGVFVMTVGDLIRPAMLSAFVCLVGIFIDTISIDFIFNWTESTCNVALYSMVVLNFNYLLVVPVLLAVEL